MASGSSGGGRSYLTVAAVMGIAVVGLLIFKSMGAQEEAPVAPPPPPPAKPVPAPSSFAPPPPPPPEVVDEPVEVKQDKPKPKVVRQNTACTGECEGTATADVRSTLRGKAGQARSCYERALSKNSALAGSLMVGVRIGARGEACSASLVSDTLGDPEVARCILQRFRTGSYPKPAGGCLDAQVPIKLVPGS